MTDNIAKKSGARLSQEEALMVEDWHLPNVTEEFVSKNNKTNAMGHSLEWYYKRQQQMQEQQVNEQEEELKPLTADDIEGIRQAAYDEGILQGHDDGFAKGHTEGSEQGYQEGLEKGKQEGYQAGFEQGEAMVNIQAERWLELAEQLNMPLHEMNEIVERQLVELAVMLAEAVIGIEVTTNEAVLFNTLKESVAALPYHDDNCQISLHPLDFALVKEKYGEETLAERGWHLISEPAIEQGGCIVESRTSSIDRTVKERLKATFSRFLRDAGIRDDND